MFLCFSPREREREREERGKRGKRAKNREETNRKKYAKILVLLTLIFLVPVVITIFSERKVFATASSLTISVSGNPTIDLPPSAEGKFVDSGDEIISVSTTHAAGYVLKVKASSATDLKNSSGTTGFTSIASAITAETFDTSAYNGKWGYKPNKLNGSANTKYQPSPTTSGSTIDSVASATNNKYTVSIGARADINTAIGSYSNTFVFTVTANPTPYKITYNANAGTDTVSGMPSDVSASSATEAVTISSDSPTRSGYDFSGWNTTVSGSGTGYAKGSTFTLSQTSTDNTLTLYAQWTKKKYIYYNSNAGTDTVEGTMAPQEITYATSAMLQAYNFKRSNYAFIGWSTKQNPVIGTDTIYGPMEDITFSNLSDDGITLYAVWLPKSTEYTMQTFSASVCSAELTATVYSGTATTTTNLSGTTAVTTSTNFTVSTNSLIALEDERDGDVYAVARLSDGNCWMLENLRLDDSVSASAIASGSQGVGGDFTKLAESEEYTNFYGHHENSLYNSADENWLIPHFNKNNIDINGTNASGTTLVPSYNSNTNSAQWYGYGNYYNWAAAIANTTQIDAGVDATTSLCPTNWRLPIGANAGTDTTNSFGVLSASMGGNTSTWRYDSSSTPTGAVISARLRQFPNNLVYPGMLWQSILRRGSSSSYWSSTSYNGNHAHHLLVENTQTRITVYSAKSVGASVRCLAGV